MKPSGGYAVFNVSLPQHSLTHHAQPAKDQRMQTDSAAISTLLEINRRVKSRREEEPAMCPSGLLLTAHHVMD